MEQYADRMASCHSEGEITRLFEQTNAGMILPLLTIVGLAVDDTTAEDAATHQQGIFRFKADGGTSVEPAH